MQTKGFIFNENNIYFPQNIVQNFNVVTTCEFYICCSSILFFFFRRFKCLQILTKFVFLSIALAMLNTILPIVTEIPWINFNFKIKLGMCKMFIVKCYFNHDSCSYFQIIKYYNISKYCPLKCRFIKILC